MDGLLTTLGLVVTLVLLANHTWYHLFALPLVVVILQYYYISLFSNEHLYPSTKFFF